MEIEYSKKEIKFGKEFNELDNLAIEFCKIFNKLNINYVIISGYVAILFGRSRLSEDIDIFFEKIDFDKFKILWYELTKKFLCINTDACKEAYEDYLIEKYAIRFSKNKFIPNIEIKFPKIDLDYWAIKNKIKVLVNDNALFISPLELQIPFKFVLGTEKDIEDALYLFNLFKERLDKNLLEHFVQKLNIGEIFNKYKNKIGIL
ncbi:hypothetical protein HYX16_04445 [Candidatus Woesearchaeota archaeon]|nr:hypothetical protein [Candidatus Woesearchaeota archaeon]